MELYQKPHAVFFKIKIKRIINNFNGYTLNYVFNNSCNFILNSCMLITINAYIIKKHNRLYFHI